MITMIHLEAIRPNKRCKLVLFLITSHKLVHFFLSKTKVGSFCFMSDVALWCPSNVYTFLPCVSFILFWIIVKENKPPFTHGKHLVPQTFTHGKHRIFECWIPFLWPLGFIFNCCILFQLKKNICMYVFAGGWRSGGIRRKKIYIYVCYGLMVLLLAIQLSWETRYTKKHIWFCLGYSITYEQ